MRRDPGPTAVSETSGAPSAFARRASPSGAARRWRASAGGPRCATPACSHARAKAARSARGAGPSQALSARAARSTASCGPASSSTSSEPRTCRPSRPRCSWTATATASAPVRASSRIARNTRSALSPLSSTATRPSLRVFMGSPIPRTGRGTLKKAASSRPSAVRRHRRGRRGWFALPPGSECSSRGMRRSGRTSRDRRRVHRYRRQG